MNVLTVLIQLWSSSMSRMPLLTHHSRERHVQSRKNHGNPLTFHIDQSFMILCWYRSPWLKLQIGGWITIKSNVAAVQQYNSTTAVLFRFPAITFWAPFYLRDSLLSFAPTFLLLKVRLDRLNQPLCIAPTRCPIAMATSRISPHWVSWRGGWGTRDTRGT